MAHFCVLVVTETPEGVRDALRPFHDDDRDEGPAQPHFIFIEDRHSDINPSNGRRGYWRNPQGKWDGWVTGGRFSGLLAEGRPDGSDDASPEQAGDRATAGNAARLLARHPDRTAQVHALLIAGRWIEPAPQAAALLAALPERHIVTVIDCHS